MDAKEICKYYDENGSNHYSFLNLTTEGVFIPTQPSLFYDAMDILMKGGHITLDDCFCDAGSGDGRNVAITSGVFGIKSIGVECSWDLIRDSVEHFQRLGIEKPYQFFNGNFLNNETYTGPGFEDITFFFNFIDGDNELATKIADESPSGTKLLVYGGSGGDNYPGLELLGNIRVTDTLGTMGFIDRLNFKILGKVGLSNMALYRK